MDGLRGLRGIGEKLAGLIGEYVKTDDWVVIYYHKDAGEEQCTVVTDQKGPLKGKRVIRGREIECADYYA